MAIWQVPFRLKKSNGFLHINNNTFLQSLKILDKALPQEISWCENYKQYGNIESTVIEFDFSEVIIDCIFLRIDLRNVTKQQLQEICEFSQKNDLVMDYDGLLYEVNLDNFIKIFQISQAYKFLRNPHTFLEKLTDKTGTNQGTVL